MRKHVDIIAVFLKIVIRFKSLRRGAYNGIAFINNSTVGYSSVNQRFPNFSPRRGTLSYVIIGRGTLWINVAENNDFGTENPMR